MAAAPEEQLVRLKRDLLALAKAVATKYATGLLYWSDLRATDRNAQDMRTKNAMLSSRRRIERLRACSVVGSETEAKTERLFSTK